MLSWWSYGDRQARHRPALPSRAASQLTTLPSRCRVRRTQATRPTSRGTCTAARSARIREPPGHFRFPQRVRQQTPRATYRRPRRPRRVLRHQHLAGEDGERDGLHRRQSGASPGDRPRGHVVRDATRACAAPAPGQTPPPATSLRRTAPGAPGSSRPAPRHPLS